MATVEQSCSTTIQFRCLEKWNECKDSLSGALNAYLKNKTRTGDCQKVGNAGSLADDFTPWWEGFGKPVKKTSNAAANGGGAKRTGLFL